MDIGTLLITLLRDAFWSAIAALGFSILFNVPRQMLAGGMICAAAGHALRTLLMQAGLDIAPATLVGALVIGFMGIGFARYWQAPSVIFTLSAAVTLVPGVFAYRAMLGILQVSASTDPAVGGPLLVEATTNAIKTALILGAIGVGIIAPRLLFMREKPVV
jgi:uncharacterized membrane protein YjjB (DUF3815 family)